MLRERWQNGKVATGVFLQIPSPEIVELFGIAGFDFVLIDMEHGPYDVDSVRYLLRGAEAAGISTLVRILHGTKI